MGGPKKKSKAGNIALFFFYMALNATGGTGIGQIFFEDAAGYFQRVVLDLHFLVAADTQTMIGRFVIPGSNIFINNAGFGFLRGLGHIMTAASATSDNRLFVDDPFVVAGLTGETKVGGMIKINGSPFCLNALQGFQQNLSHRDTHFFCIIRSGNNHRISKNYRQNQTKNAKAYLIHPHLPCTDFVKWLNS